MYDGTVVFRAEPYSELGTYGWHSDLAFEVDRLDYHKHQGWSVVAFGQAELVQDPDELRRIEETCDPHPWVSGHYDIYIKMTWRDITGRLVEAGPG